MHRRADEKLMTVFIGLQPVTDKINTRKVTIDDIPWCCEGLQGLLKENL